MYGDPSLLPVLLPEHLNQQYPFSTEGYIHLNFLNSTYIFLYQQGLKKTASNNIYFYQNDIESPETKNIGRKRSLLILDTLI
jgi:hypothetical protein